MQKLGVSNIFHSTTKTKIKQRELLKTCLAPPEAPRRGVFSSAPAISSLVSKVGKINFYFEMKSPIEG